MDPYWTGDLVETHHHWLRWCKQCVFVSRTLAALYFSTSSHWSNHLQNSHGASQHLQCFSLTQTQIHITFHVTDSASARSMMRRKTCWSTSWGCTSCIPLSTREPSTSSLTSWSSRASHPDLVGSWSRWSIHNQGPKLKAKMGKLNRKLWWSMLCLRPNWTWAPEKKHVATSYSILGTVSYPTKVKFLFFERQLPGLTKNGRRWWCSPRPSAINIDKLHGGSEKWRGIFHQIGKPPTKYMIFDTIIIMGLFNNHYYGVVMGLLLSTMIYWENYGIIWFNGGLMVINGE